jgi:hypothetical protein
MDALAEAATRQNGVLELVRSYAQDRHDEGYERGVHDVDAALVLDKLVAMHKTSGRLRYSSDARAVACLHWAELGDAGRMVLHRRARSFGRLRERLSSSSAQDELARELLPSMRATVDLSRIASDDSTLRGQST